MYFGVVRLNGNYLDKLTTSKKNQLILNKTSYLWAIVNGWPPSYSGIANNQDEVVNIAIQHGINITSIDFDPKSSFNENLRFYANCNHPIYSYIERQSRLYFVCVWGNNLQFLCDIDPIIEIDNITRNEAMVMRPEWDHPNNKAKSWNGQFIHAYIRRREAKRKFSTPKIGSDFVFVEFLYSPEWEYRLPRKNWVWQRHRIVKKTDQTIFVEEAPYQGSSYLKTGWQAFIVYTIMIDRSTLESEHQYYHRTRHKTFFEKCAVPELKNIRFINYDAIFDDDFDSEYDTDDVIEIPVNSVQWALSILKIDIWPQSKHEIKKIFNRLSIKAHPDRSGGNHQEMVFLNRAKKILIDEIT